MVFVLLIEIINRLNILKILLENIGIYSISYYYCFIFCYYGVCRLIVYVLFDIWFLILYIIILRIYICIN